MRISLLGVPVITSSDGALCPVRGYQTWAVLARVLLTPRPLSRRTIASELFSETTDPLGALRWCLAALRRALGAETMTGDPLCANLPAGCRVDVLSLNDSDFDPLNAGELLEGSEPESCGPEFSIWLLVERARMKAIIDERLRRETLSCLTTMKKERALELARHAVQRDPFDEGRHVLLVKALVLSGNSAAACLHVEKVEADFFRELGERPSSALRDAAKISLSKTSREGEPAILAETLMEAGKAALAAGAVDAGVDCLRRALAGAEQGEDHGLTARCLVELGTALVHAVRGYDDEGTICLRRAEELATSTNTRPINCLALLEQSYCNALAGRRPDAHLLAMRAAELADGDVENLAAASCFAAFNYVDWGRYEEAFNAYDHCLQLSRRIGAKRRETWALGLGAWGQLRAGTLDQAEEWARNSVRLCDDQRWLSFRPWPETVLAEAELKRKSVSPLAVRSKLETTLALSCQISDPCWEAAASRVIGLSFWEEARPDSAMFWLDRALQAVTRVTDPYAGLWTRILLDQAKISLEMDRSEAESHVRALIGLAARTHADVELSEALNLLRQVRVH